MNKFNYNGSGAQGLRGNTAPKNFIILCDDAIIGGPQEYNVRSFCKIFHELGYDSHAIGFNHQSEEDNNWVEDEKIFWHIFGAKVYGNPVKRRFLRYFKIQNILNSCELFKNAEIVLCISWNRVTESIILKKLKNKFNFKIIYDICEWFDVKRYFDEIRNTKDFIDKIFKYIAEIFWRRYTLVKNKYVRVVSKQLEKYYKSKNCHIIRTPNLIELEKSYTPVESKNGVLTLGYFGSPSRHNTKDLFNNTVKGLALLNEDEKIHVKFHVYGLYENELESMFEIDKNTQDAVKDVMRVHGKIDKDKVKEELQKCDFTVLLRESTYSLECCLPSKMTESISYGVPMICNLTSNMGEYLSDGYNAIISPSKEPEDFAECVKKAIKLTPEEKKIYKINAYESGKKYFDWRNYVEPMKNFIAEILQEENS